MVPERKESNTLAWRWSRGRGCGRAGSGQEEQMGEHNPEKRPLTERPGNAHLSSGHWIGAELGSGHSVGLGQSSTDKEVIE